MNLQPLFDRVVLKLIEPENKTKSGIVIPQAGKERPLLAKVVAVGDGGDAEDKPKKMYVKPGDKILYSKYAGSEFKIDGEEVVIIRQTDILAIIKGE